MSDPRQWGNQFVNALAQISELSSTVAGAFAPGLSVIRKLARNGVMGN